MSDLVITQICADKLFCPAGCILHDQNSASVTSVCLAPTLLIEDDRIGRRLDRCAHRLSQTGTVFQVLAHGERTARPTLTDIFCRHHPCTPPQLRQPQALLEF